MGQLVFQAALGGTTALVGPNTTATNSINIPDASGTLAISGGSPSFTNLAYTGTLTGGTGVVNLGSGQFYKDASGNVGIGTSSPAARLDVQSIQSIIKNTSTTGINPVAIVQGNTGGNYYVGVDGNTGGYLGTAYAAFNWMSGAYPMVFATSNTERMRIDSSGNVGIGTTSPNVKLDVNGTMKVRAAGLVNLSNSDSTNEFYLQNSGATGANNAILTFQKTNYGEVMRIDSSGNVLIGRTSSAGKLSIQTAGGATNAIDLYSPSSTNGARIQLNDGNYSAAIQTVPSGGATSLAFEVSGSERMRISAAGIVTMSAYGAGAATFSSAGVISSVSDETWKIKDGIPVNPENMLQKLEPGYWFYNEEKKEIFGTERQLGFYAQNVNEAIGPEAAPEPEEGKPWGYYDRSVLAVVVMSLKNALVTIEELNAKVTALEGTK